MLLSQIGDKEIIDISTGCKYGELWDAEIIFDKSTGKIFALILPTEKKTFPWSRTEDSTTLPWDSIVKISPSLILFESGRCDRCVPCDEK